VVIHWYYLVVAMKTGKAQGCPRIIQRVVKKQSHHYKNNNALYDIDIQRREFIRNIRAYGKPSQKIDVRGQGERCSFSPPCRHSAVELWVWASRKELLCEVELQELQK